MVKNLNKSTGLLGGSFDPAHKGHLEISKIAISKVKLNEILWLVTKRNPFKKKPFYSLQQRLKQAEKISKSVKKIKVIHLDKVAGSTRSVDIINYLINKKKNQKYPFYNWI